MNRRADDDAPGTMVPRPLAVATVVLLVGLAAGGYLAWNRDRPDPQTVVQTKLLDSAEHLAQRAERRLLAEDSPEAARDAFAKDRSEVVASRVIAPDRVEWDLILAGGASDRYIARGQLRKFHTCFRLAGRTGRKGSVIRTDLPCPDAVSAPDRALANSVLLHLPNTN